MTHVVDNTIVFDKETYEARRQWYELYQNNYTYDHLTMIATPKMVELKDVNKADMAMSDKIVPVNVLARLAANLKLSYKKN